MSQPPHPTSTPNHFSQFQQMPGSQRAAFTHPPSRLSPPPGTAIPDLLAQSGSGSASDGRKGSLDNGKKKEETGPKRGYRACVHCRLRKARCDLGDVNAPSSPPCSRCRREQRSCVFLPSKRRKKNQSDDPDQEAEVYPVSGGDTSMGSISQMDWKPNPFQLNTNQNSMTNLPDPLTTPSWPDSMFSSSATSNGPSLPQHQQQSVQQPHAAPLHSSFLDQSGSVTLNVDPPSLPHTGTTPGSVPESNGSGSALSPAQRTKRRRQHSPDATRRIVAANFSNETDALEILANAAAENDSDDAGKRSPSTEAKRGVRWSLQEDPVKVKGLEEYCLVKAGLMTVFEMETLVRLFFENNHPVLPIFQTSRIPKTLPQLAQLASSDAFLLSTMMLVASRHHPEPRMKTVHEKLWRIVREALADYSFSGLPAAVGFVEGVLLLAEFLPREQPTQPLSRRLLGGENDEGALEGIENRRSWALTGLAIRAAYGIGLDQIALEVGGERTAEVERARSAWTWCYLYDRTIGLAFWSRGPTLCFLGYSHISQTGEAAARENFPYMLSPGGPLGGSSGDDSASLMQALMELTQIMTNAHDILYPSKGRTSALVSQGTYFKYCDHFRKALDTYALVWTDKTWKNPALKELASCTYQFVRLYVSSFAFQAHVQRAQLRAEEDKAKGALAGNGGEIQLFPRGSATSPDALYIYESIDAANEILNICLRLGQMGVLQNLPSRYLINFVYGGVFALKAGYSGATSKKDMLKTKETVDTVCAALVLSCPDRDHPASRYGGMLRMLAKKLEQLSDASVRASSPNEVVEVERRPDIKFLLVPVQAVPSRFPSPEPTAATSNDIPNPFGPTTDMSSIQMSDFAMPANHAADGLFDFDVEGINFNLDGFWDDFSLLGEQSGFPFK